MFQDQVSKITSFAKLHRTMWLEGVICFYSRQYNNMSVKIESVNVMSCPNYTFYLSAVQIYLGLRVSCSIDDSCCCSYACTLRYVQGYLCSYYAIGCQTECIQDCFDNFRLRIYNPLRPLQNLHGFLEKTGGFKTCS